MSRTSRRKLTLERSYPGAAIEDVWELWTTPAGIESWWGPEGFATKVLGLDLRSGGGMRYAMTAVGPAQVEFMKQAGLPLTSEVSLTYAEVTAPRRLAFTQLADFVPGVAPYDVETVVELQADAQGVRMVLTLEAMHDEEWTGRAVMGWESQLGRLAAAIEARGPVVR